MKLAAIDIGSNSIHLVIVRAEPGRHLEIIDREKEMVRLGSGTLTAHRLSAETMERALTTLRRFKQMAEANRVDLIVATATSAVRESDNASEFVDRVRSEAGLDVQLLPGVEEARLIALAVSEVTDFNGRRALIVDIGGGSTEFAITSGKAPDLLLSVRLGAVRLTEKYVTTDPISEGERDRLIANIRTDLARVVREVTSLGFDFVIGSSGTVLNLVDAAVQSDSDGRIGDRSGFNSFSHTVTVDQLNRLNRRLAGMTLRERGRVPGIEKERADIIVAGGLLLETILSELGASQITSCDWSLREGVLLDYLRQQSRGLVGADQTAKLAAEAYGAGEHTLSQITAGVEPDVRIRSVLSLARRYDYDATHSHLVARLAARIFDDTRDLHGLGVVERSLLQYAALLHDIGYHIAHNNHHRHGLYLIKNSEMPGFTASEIAVMATVVRYHRGSIPKRSAEARGRAEHEDFVALDRAHRAVVRRLAAILQIADGLDRSHRQAVSDVRCELVGNRALFHVESGGECELELWSAERKASWFADIFGVSVSFERAISAAAEQDSTAVTTS